MEFYHAEGVWGGGEGEMGKTCPVGRRRYYFQRKPVRRPQPHTRDPDHMEQCRQTVGTGGRPGGDTGGPNREQKHGTPSGKADQCQRRAFRVQSEGSQKAPMSQWADDTRGSGACGDHTTNADKTHGYTRKSGRCEQRGLNPRFFPSCSWEVNTRVCA